jgi:hypothetical protein
LRQASIAKSLGAFTAPKIQVLQDEHGIWVPANKLIRDTTREALDHPGEAIFKPI